MVLFLGLLRSIINSKSILFNKPLYLIKQMNRLYPLAIEDVERLLIIDLTRLFYCIIFV